MPAHLLRPLLILAGVAVAGPSLAQDQEPPVPETFHHVVRQGMWQEQFLAKVMEPFRQADRDNDGVNAEDLAFQSRFSDIQRRVQQVNQMIRRDLDGDGRTTAEEIGVVLREEMRRRGTVQDTQVRRALKRETDRIMALDRDKDGTVTIDEALRVDAATPNNSYGRDMLVLGYFMERDPDGDGTLTEAELRTLAIAIFGRIDRNGDKMLDQNEYRNLINRNRDRIAANVRFAPCDLPKVQDNAKLVMVGIYRGSAITSVAIGDDGRLVTGQKLVIEPGDEKLYLVLSNAQPVVWSLSGATDRVSRVVVIPQSRNGEGAGVMGLAKDRVSFMPPGTCNAWFVKADGGRAQLAATRISGVLDRPVGATFGLQRLDHATLALPSGKTEKVDRPRFDPAANDSPLPLQVRRDLWHQAPGGYMRLDPESLVASQKARPVDPRPGIFGIADLFEAGHLVRRSDGMLEVVKPFDRFPLAIPGAYRRFMFPDAIPIPKGTVRGLQIWSKETGEPRRFKIDQ